MDLVGFGPSKDQVRKVEVNRKLAHLFAAAFEKIKAANHPYVLHVAGGYFFRYMLNDDVCAALVNRPEYAELRKQPGFMSSWNIHQGGRGGDWLVAAENCHSSGTSENRNAWRKALFLYAATLEAKKKA